MAALLALSLANTLSVRGNTTSCNVNSSGSGFFAGSASVCARVPAAHVALPSQRLVIECSKKVQGTVVGTVNDKTAAVEVKRIYRHPLYKKRISSVKRYQAHDPENKCKVGDIVTLLKCAPVSKTKKFVVAEITPPRVSGSAAKEPEQQLPPLESELAL
eukprot:TRINITY_DN242_c0_g1_i1.p1 TRINITY_DN242_c0_g1~~TRINITY_DN242_c0_g1_i1.p1  ORF type:complete len:187 (+),score=48.57 TRINITY_DN242_c0_g1_i1:87-563(+)